MANHARYTPLAKDAANFSAVGILCYVLDVTIFNVLRVVSPSIFGGPLVAKTAGVLVATIAAWLGSRYWTFRRNKRRNVGAEFVEFILVAVAGYLVNLAILWFSHYTLGFHSLLADNISGNIIGALLGTSLRFLLYRHWVYRAGRGSTSA